jgi:hypothetical protein
MSLFSTINIATNGQNGQSVAVGAFGKDVANDRTINFNGLSDRTKPAIEPRAVIAGLNYISNVHPDGPPSTIIS